MRRTLLAALVCLAGLAAGCGSSTKTVTKPTTPAAPGTTGAPGSTNGSTTGGTSGTSGTSIPTGMHPGSTGTMGPPPGGGKFDLHSNTVLKHLLQQIVNQLASNGDTGVAGTCRAFSSTQAECEIKGTNSHGQHFDNLFTLTVNLSTGQFTITNIKPASGMQPGSTGTMGPPPGGGKFNLHSNTVLKHLLQQIVNQLASNGDTGVSGTCRAFSSTQAGCEIKGTNSHGQQFDNLFTLTVNLSTGQFTITNVKPAH